MQFLLPWSVLSALPIRVALSGLNSAVADRDPHSVRAYVALRMLHTRIYRLPEPEDIDLCLSEAAAESLALYATGQGGPWGPLADIIYQTLEEADGPDEEEEEVPRPAGPTVRESRARLDGLA